MRIDEVEFARSLSSSPNAQRTISGILDVRSVARTVLIMDRMEEEENPFIEMDPGSTCWQMSPYGHPMSVSSNNLRGNKNSRSAVRLPLHTFQTFSPPSNPIKQKDVEGAAHHISSCEALSFLSLVSGMVGNNWNEIISKPPEVVEAIRAGISEMSKKKMKPAALMCDRGSFETIVGKMRGFTNEFIDINGARYPMATLTVGENKMKVFTYDVMSPDGGMIFLCSHMMGMLSQCGDVKFWLDQSGPTGVFSIRTSMCLLLREAVFAIKRKE